MPFAKNFSKTVRTHNININSREAVVHDFKLDDDDDM